MKLPMRFLERAHGFLAQRGSLREEGRAQESGGRCDVEFRSNLPGWGLRSAFLLIDLEIQDDVLARVKTRHRTCGRFRVFFFGM
jgi:hypothetical protein